MKRIKVIVLVLAGVILFNFNVKGADDRPMHEIHSMMVFNFAKYVSWPSTNTTGNFVIGVIGSDDVYNTLNQWYSHKSRGSQKVVIIKFDSFADITNCEVLYLGTRASKQFNEVKLKLNGKATLLISDKAGLGKKGSSINFKVVEGKLKFEINKQAVDKAQLKISSQLTGMAIMI